MLRLAWPAVCSYILHNAYRINDQYWVQGLGRDAQAAIGTSFFIIILNFAVLFLAAGGTLALVARATGSGDRKRVDTVTRHAILFALGLAVAIGVPGSIFAEEIVATLALEPTAAGHATEYLGTLYMFLAPIALVPVLDNVFIGRGKTKIPLVLDSAAIAINYLLNPVLIYGGTAVATLARADGSVPWGAELADRIANDIGIEAMGLSGAALATASSRAVTSALGLLVLRYGFGCSLLGSLRPRLAEIGAIARLSGPVSLSIGVYASVYLTILTLVMAPFSTDVKAGLGLGFQVFEGMSFPCYLGVAMAGASLVGQKLGAKDHLAAREVVQAARFISRILGVCMTLAFLFAGPFVLPWFTQDPGVTEATLTYVMALACSQYWVAVEIVNEKVLLGAGYTKPILWIAGFGNVLRVPLAWTLASFLGYGPIGVWWAINTTTYLKAGLFWSAVRRGRWVTHLDELERRDARS